MTCRSFTDRRTICWSLRRSQENKTVSEILGVVWHKSKRSTALSVAQGIFSRLIIFSFSWRRALPSATSFTVSQRQHWRRPAEVRQWNLHRDLVRVQSAWLPLVNHLAEGVFLLEKVHIVIKRSDHQMLTLCVVVQLAFYRLAAFDGEHSLRFGEID